MYVAVAINYTEGFEWSRKFDSKKKPSVEVIAKTMENEGKSSIDVLLIIEDGNVTSFEVPLES